MSGGQIDIWPLKDKEKSMGGLMVVCFFQNKVLSTEPTAYHSSPSGVFSSAGEILWDEVLSKFAVVVENPYHAILDDVYHSFFCFCL